MDESRNRTFQPADRRENAASSYRKELNLIPTGEDKVIHRRVP